MTDPSIYDLQTKLTAFIEKLRPKIQEFLSKPCLPTWLPPGSVDEDIRMFYTELAIPLVDGKPNFLLHNLREPVSPSGVELFPCYSPHRILCNASGSGKTRLLFEGLCQKWGFYFIAARGPDGIGSQDLEDAIETLPRTRGWMRHIPQDYSARATCDYNESIAGFRFSKVVLARSIVFNTFIKVARDQNGGALPQDIKIKWLLFQIFPSHFCDQDPFMEVVNQCLLDLERDTFNTLMFRGGFYPPQYLRQ